jgi:hypothetical protein
VEPVGVVLEDRREVREVTMTWRGNATRTAEQVRRVRVAVPADGERAGSGYDEVVRRLASTPIRSLQRIG